MTTATGRKSTRKEKLDIISLRQFDKAIPDEDAAIAYAEKVFWGDTPRCGHCGSDNVHRVKSGKPMSHRCRDCQSYFSVRTGTLMAETNLPVLKWLKCIHLLHTHRKGISSIALSNLLETTQRTAWFLAHRIRAAMQRGDLIVRGVVETDETFVGGKMKGIHKSKRPDDPNSNKFPVIGFRDGTGRVVAFPIDNTRTKTIEKAVLDNVAAGSIIYTDGLPSYKRLPRFGFDHYYVNHKVGQFVHDLATTNGIESFWALLKRGYIGTHHWMSKKHLFRYVEEFAGRHNSGKGNGLATICADLLRMKGKRLTWEALTTG